MVRTKEVARMSTGGFFPHKGSLFDPRNGSRRKPAPYAPGVLPTAVGAKKSAHCRAVIPPISGRVKKPMSKPKPKPKPQRYRPGREPVGLRSGKRGLVNEEVNNYQVISDDDDGDDSWSVLGSGSGLASPQVTLTGSATPQSDPSSLESQSMEMRPENLSLLTLAAEQMQLQDGPCPSGSCAQATVEDAAESVPREIVEDPKIQVQMTSVNREVSNVFERSSQQCATSSLSLMAMADLVDENDATEVNSIGCNGWVSVHEYRVKPQNAELLRRILSRYGDIGAKCALVSVAARSFFMELVCETLQELMTTDLTKMTENKIQSLKASLGDVEKEEIDVGWLKARLDEILEAKQAIRLLKPSSNLRQLRAEQETKIQTRREQLTVYGNDLSIKMNEIHTLRQKIESALLDLSVEEDEARKIDLTISECKAKLGYLTKLETLASDLV